MPPKNTKAARSRTCSQPTRSPSPTEEYNCVDCSKPDSADNMVQCDACKTWHHYNCVGVDDSINDRSWVCGTACTTGKKSDSFNSEVVSMTTGNVAPSIATHNAVGSHSVTNTLPSMMGAITTSVPSMAMHEDIGQHNSSPYNLQSANASTNMRPFGQEMPSTSRDALDHIASQALKAYPPSLPYTASSVAIEAAPATANGVSPPLANINASSGRFDNDLSRNLSINNNISVVSNNNFNLMRNVQTDAISTSNLRLGLNTANKPLNAFLAQSSMLNTSSIPKSAIKKSSSAMSYAAKPPQHLQPNQSHLHPITIPSQNLHSQLVHHSFNSSSQEFIVPTISTPRATTSAHVPTNFVAHSTKALSDKNRTGQRRLSHSSTTSKGSRTSFERSVQIELQLLDEERELKEKRDAEYMEKKHKILSRVAIDDGSSSVTDEEMMSVSKVNKWFDNNSRKPPPEPAVTQMGSNTEQNYLVANRMAAQNSQVIRNDLGRSWSGNVRLPDEAMSTQQHIPIEAHNSTFNVSAPYQHPPQVTFGQTQQPTTSSALAFCANEREIRNLSKSQMAARHLVSKDLPEFDGNPEQWPLFISNLERSTQLCGFTAEENIMRLNKALVGKAKDAVKWLLIQPNCFHEVMARLKTLYGRPEFILHTLLQKLSKTPPPKDAKLDSILSFSLEVQNLYATILATGLQSHLNNPTLLTQLEGKLPPNILLNWGIYKNTLPDCTLAHFSAWIFQLAEAANGVLIPSLNTTPSTEVKTNHRNQGPRRRTEFLNAHAQVDINNNELRTKCCICKDNCSSVANCKQFRLLSRTSKWTAVREHKLCSRCLKKHNTRDCPSTQICGKDDCPFKHHQLLHNDQKRSNEESTNGKQSQQRNVSEPVESHCNIHRDTSNVSLFRIIPVILHGNGVQLKTFAFLDDGSSLTLMDSEIAEQLNLIGKPQPLCLKWTANTHRYERQSKLFNMCISSTTPGACIYPLTDVHTVENLSLPYQSVNYHDFQSKYKHLKGLPIESYHQKSPRLLIGLRHTNLGLPLKCREGSSEEPVATKTRLGWMIHGGSPQRTSNYEDKHQHHNLHVCECNDAGLHRLVKDFMFVENFGVTNSDKTLMPTEDKRALDQLEAHTVRKNGRYETSLLWKFDNFIPPDSLPMARRRLVCLQKKMKREPQLARALDEKLKQFISKGYARKLTPQEIAETGDRYWYLPIFPVFNVNKPGKLRIVWDAAATTQGVSLNTMLLKGPGQLVSLVAVLFKFREDLVAIFADIMEMYHQIQIRKEDQRFQRFLWSMNQEAEPEVIAMQVMIMGATCASTTAQYVINKNADEFSARFPRAVQSIKNNQYVDDLMDSTGSPEEAIKLAKQIRFVHSQGGFNIRNWVSNAPEVVRAMKSEPTEQVDLTTDVEMGTEKVLGMWWCTASDSFTYKIKPNTDQADILSGNRRPTKREVLRILMTIFDPLGLVANFLIYIKILLQDVWRSNVEWDQEIKDAEFQKWLRWIRHLPEIAKLKIPRCYIINNSDPDSDKQLHLFVDASENGYAAVAYLRIASQGKIVCMLIGAKTKVAPLKSLSIPKLELQAAVLGVRFAKLVAESHTINFSRRFFWSDSRNVLSWIRSDHRRYKPFVAFRVSEILDYTEINDWRWIPTKLNVADEGTKWQKQPEFKDSNRWYTGPEFLKLDPSSWPIEKLPDDETVEEIRACFLNLHTMNQEGNFQASRMSSWRRLVRAASYVLRFVHNTSIKRFERTTGIVHHKRQGYLQQEELRRAETELIREAQVSCYLDEITNLSSNKPIEKNSRIYNLCPYLDANKNLRANSRISSTSIVSEDTRRPIILPRNHAITDLIIMDLHVRFNHHNHETVINELRQRFHIPQMRSALRSVRKKCQECKNTKAVPHPPIMAELPSARITPFCRPFSFVGVDYFGPMTVSILRRVEKRWGMLLTCLTTRAVHIEVAHSLSADSCIMALRNFMARRGIPNEIYSDNGTNFHGAERELRHALEEVDKQKIAETFTTTTTKWIFIPPGSPHMGGSWERLVRSIKDSLYKIKPSRNPTDELLRNMLIEVENVINSRPLTYIPIDDENGEALTPNHFLLGTSNGSKPPTIYDPNAKILRRNWLTSQQYAEHFWQRWLKEYLPTITRRSKWFQPVKAIEEGDIVLIVDPLNPRNTWPKGRVIQTRISKDGQVRSAFVRTQNGVYERPSIKLAVLDVGSARNEPTVDNTKGECKQFSTDV